MIYFQKRIGLKIQFVKTNKNNKVLLSQSYNGKLYNKDRKHLFQRNKLQVDKYFYNQIISLDSLL